MPTRYDVFAAIIEHAPCKQKDLPFKTPVHAHLRALEKEQLIQKQQRQYVPTSKTRTKHVFHIIKYCLNNGLDYNLFFSKNMPTIIQELFKHQPQLRPKKLTNNQNITQLVQYLEKYQFVLLAKLRPRTGVILQHQLLDSITQLHKTSIVNQPAPFIPVENDLLSITTDPINPFDDKTFAFLTGSAQLEGSTVTIGETKEMILNDIYPEKPKKDIQMVKNLNEALHYLIENLEEPITPEHIKEINKATLFSLHRNAGKYKKTQNKIQGNPSFKTAKPHEISSSMEEYCTFLNTIKNKKECLDQLGKIHNDIQHIHPFSDGNSRTTRMIVNWMLLKNQLPLLVLKMGCYDTYMNLTKLAKQRNDEKLKQLLHQVLYHESII